MPDQTQIDNALQTCQLFSSNAVISCFPLANTVVAQHQWTSLIWNSRRPELARTNLVDVFLFHGDSRTQILHFPSLPNPTDQAGRISTQVNDSWWGTRGELWNGSNISYPFYWVLISSTTTLDGNEIPQATFSAVQTTYADSVIASSIASASSASAASASAAALSSANASLTSTISTTSATSSQAGRVQSASSGSGFPPWAIAVIVVLGFLAIAASCILAFFIMRRREQNSNRSSMGSASPMMAHVGGPSSPLLAGAAINRHPSSVVGVGVGAAHSTQDHDGASTISRTGSAANNEAPFSGADAAIMADAFRKMLRKPDFAGRPMEEGESPDGPEPSKEEMIGRELAEEGRDIRSVRSERGVKVETLSDGGDTVQDRHGSVD